MHDNSTSLTLLSKNDIQRICDALKSAPPPERSLTKVEALKMLAPALKSARDRGHTIDSLLQQLEQQGVKVSARAVSRALGALALAGEKKIKRGHKLKSAAPATSLPDDVQHRSQLEAAGQQRLAA